MQERSSLDRKIVLPLVTRWSACPQGDPQSPGRHADTSPAAGLDFLPAKKQGPAGCGAACMRA